eukprot:3935952-Rhodomonas_salina.2
MLAGGILDLKLAGEDIGRAGVAFAESFSKYYQASKLQCDPPAMGIIDTTCYNPENRVLDLVTPLLHINKMALHVMNFIPRRCAVLEQPIAIILYPLSDIEMVKSVHHFVNSILQTFVQMPILSQLRWEATGRISLAFPDLAPMFDHFTYGCVHLGRLLDNWLDVVYYMFFTLAIPSQAVACDQVWGSWNFNVTSPVGSFGSNRTVITSLTSTMFSVTDGWNVEYHHHGRRGGVRVSHAAWPIPINVTYGVAAVAYARDISRDDVVDGPTTALFGCHCVDEPIAPVDTFVSGASALLLTCAIVPYDVYDEIESAAFIVNMTWEIANTPKRLTCRDTKISIQSLRYPTKRLTSPTEFEYTPGIGTPINCMTKGSCTTIDAAVWVMPVCPLKRDVNGQSVAGNSACMRALKDFSCFPFCLGVRRSFAANEPIVIWSSSAWENNVLLPARDCVFETLGTVDKDAAFTSTTILQQEETTAGAWVPKSSVPQILLIKIKQPTPSTANDDNGESAVVQRQCNLNDNVISSLPVLNHYLFNSSQWFQQQQDRVGVCK